MGARLQLRTVCRHFDAKLLKGHVRVLDFVLNGSVVKYGATLGDFRHKFLERIFLTLLYDCAEQVNNVVRLRCGRFGNGREMWFGGG